MEAAAAASVVKASRNKTFPRLLGKYFILTSHGVGKGTYEQMSVAYVWVAPKLGGNI